ncbi:unnamed protein product [Rotaria sordida]|uniref:Centriolin n=2 Tax=Rotaria sordida TaxID=392033 RepID=A0A818UWL1_9BILA|nr:unnamed protein product [Rotaria sordida]CAF3706521.1 unnamed protein product [Rotaria sordida]
MEIERNDRRSPDGRHSESISSPTMSHDSALPATPTLQYADLDDDDDDDDNDDDTNVSSQSRSKSTDGRVSRINSASQPFTTTTTSVDRLKHGIRYITDGFIRKITKQNNVTRIHSLNFNNLRDKKIRYIENLQTLINLENLDLSNNLIEKIDGLKTLKKLKSLSLANNFINTIINLEDLSRLENLNFHHNQIHTIPIWFGKKLTSLKILNLSNNHISSFDQIARLRTLYELRELHLQGNSIEQNENYRLLVISYVPSLQRLDGIDINENERKQAKEQFIQQEVQNLLHELERRDNECRRLNTQAINSGQQLEITSDKLQTVENKSLIQAKEIKDLQERLTVSEELLQRKTSLLHQACEKQCKLEQELAFYKIDLKFDRLDFSKHLNQKSNLKQRTINDSPFTTIKFNNNIEDEDDIKLTMIDEQQQQRSMSTIQWQTAEVKRILGSTPDGKFLRAEDETIYNEKLLQLAFNMSELTFLQAKQQTIEDRLQIATQKKESHAVIEHLSDDLNNLQTEMMNKISDVQELKLVLSGLRADEGHGLSTDLEQVNIELKLDEIVRQHVIKLKQQSIIQPQEYDVVNESTFEQALTEAISLSGVHAHDRCSETATSPRVQLLEYTSANNVEQFRTKEISEQEAQNKIIELQIALEREQNQAREHINQIEEMAEREKQRILRHLEDEKRFTRDIIIKSETMIEQLKRELSSERKHKTDEQKTRDALRDIYKKISPDQGKTLSKSTKNETNIKDNDDDDDDDDDDDNDESRLDGETTVYHRDDLFLASTPRDRSLLTGRNEYSDSNALRRQLEEQLQDDNDESLLNDQKLKSNLTTGTTYSYLPPTPKRRINTKFHSNELSSSFDKTQPTIMKIDPTLNDGDEEENDLLYRLHGFVKTGQAYTSGLGDFARTTGNDSGYSSQQTGRENNIENAKLESLLSTKPFHIYNKCLIDPEQFNREYTVGVFTTNTGQQSRYCDKSKVGNVTLYPTPEGYMLGPHSVTVSPETFPIYANVSPTQSLTHTDSQFFACVNIPPDGLSSNRPLSTSRHNPDEVRLQGPVIFRQDTILKSENVSPVSVKIRSLKFPQVEKSTMTDPDAIRREIDRTSDEIDYLKLKLQHKENHLQHNDQLHLLRDTLEQQIREIERVKILHQDLLNSGRDNEENILDLSQQIQRIQQNVHGYLRPTLLRLVDDTSRINTGKLIPLTNDDHWICNVPRHADLEQIIADLEVKMDEQQQELANLKHENRRLERSLIKKTIKIDALDLASSRKRSRSIADSAETDSLQDDIFVLEQQLVRKQREITLAQEQLKQMTSLSQNVIHDLKTARQRHTITKRETKGLEQKIEYLTRKLYKLTSDTKQAEESYAKTTTNIQLMNKEQVKLEKIVDEKRALSIVLDEQLRSSLNSFNSLLNSSIKCLQELTSTTRIIDDEFHFNSLPPPPSLQINPISSNLAPDEIQRQISHIISENHRILSRYHSILQQQKQKSILLKNELTEKETILVNVKSDLDAYNEQIRKNAKELLQDKNVLEELERVKELKSDKLAELDRLIERRQTQERQAQQELEQLTNDQQRLKKQYKDILSEHDQLQHTIEADRQVLNEMKNESTRLREQIKSFLDDKETLDETCDLLAKKCEALHNECKEKENNLPILISQIDEKLTVCKNLEDEIKKLKTDKTRCLEEVTEMKIKIEKKRIELEHSPHDIEFEHRNEELKQRIKRNEQDLDRLNSDIDERNRTLNELNTMIAYAKNIMKNIQPNENRRNYKHSSSSDFSIVDQRHQQENTAYYETKIQRLTKALDDKEQELRSLNMQLITTKDELLQMQYKVQNQESNADGIRNSMQIELDKLRHWLQIYENRKAMLRPQYHETLKELELKLHEQEMFFRKQIKDLDSEMKKKYHGKPSDDSGFLSDTTLYDNRISPTNDTNDTSMLREQIQNIFSQHVQELDKCNTKYKTNLSNLKNRLHELENSATTTNRLDS